MERLTDEEIYIEFLEHSYPPQADPPVLWKNIPEEENPESEDKFYYEKDDHYDDLSI